MIPMIKADAYGHGAVWAAQTLGKMPGLYGFGVATLEEGIRLRTELGPKYRKTKILVFSGTAPWIEEKGQICESHGLTPIICRGEDWDAFFKQGWAEKIRYELKFNTGMNRLGIHPEKARSILKNLQTLSHDHQPDAVLSHLAVGEEPDSPLSRRQIGFFRELRGLFEAHSSAIHFHLANSAAVWNAKHWGLEGLTDAIRPGISLYGVPPWKGAPVRGLQSVMTLKSQVIAIHQLKIGDRVGYGGRYTATADSESSKRIAILSAGYADGIHRMLSDRGHVRLSGKVERVLGTVSMDLTAVACSPTTRVGEYAEWLSPQLDIWLQSEAAGTVPYELLTSVSGRVQRVYVDSR